MHQAHFVVRTLPALGIAMALGACSGSSGAQRLTPAGASLDAAARAAGAARIEFAYVANFGSSSVSAYGIDAKSGALTQVAGSPFAAGSGPVGLAIDPKGKYAYVGNFFDGTVSGYSLNATTGALTSIAGSPFGAGPIRTAPPSLRPASSPTCRTAGQGASAPMRSTRAPAP